MKDLVCKVCGQPLKVVEDISTQNEYRKYIVVCPNISNHDLNDFNSTVKIFYVYDTDIDLSDYYERANKSKFQEFIIKNHKLFRKD